MEILSSSSVKKGFPKWDGIIDLRDAGLKVPRAAFSTPLSKESQIRELVVNFLQKTNTDLLALRPDGGNGFGATPSGVNLARSNIDQIVQKILGWNSRNLGVVLLDTHSRFDYDFSCNCLFDDDGSFHLEFVGPGFDGGELNKAILLPTLIIKSKFFSSIFDYSDPISGEANLDKLGHVFFRVEIESRTPTQKEIETRLKYIASQLLPDMGIDVAKTEEGAIRWLTQNHYIKLFKYKHIKNYVSAEELKELILSASRYANKLKQNGQPLKGKVLTAHKYDENIIFFGTFNDKKWRR